MQDSKSFGVFFPVFKKDLSLTSWMLSVGSTNNQTLLAFALGKLFIYIFNEKPNVWFRVCPFDFRLVFKVDIKFWMSDRLCYSKNVLHTEKLQNSVWTEFSIAGQIIEEPDIHTSTPVPIVVGPLTPIHTLFLVCSRAWGLTFLLFWG